MTTPWRSVFISDIHIGARGAQVARLIGWLEKNPCQRLYIVGDLFDGLHAVRLSNVMDFLTGIARAPEVIFIPGNHDALFRSSFGNFGWLRVCPGAIHVARDGRRYLITHGDEFDATSSSLTLEAIGAWLNETARRFAASVGANWINSGLDAASRALNAIATRGRLKARLAGLCAVGEFDGVVTGHFHDPAIHEIAPGILHLDCGDWIIHCTAIVETESGSLQLLRAA